jgi:nicotinamidase-related amidase
MKFLIVVDCQNDFISGALKNDMAQEIIPRIANYIKQFEGIVIFTRDTHGSDYLETMEGKNLPIPHCIAGTEGWEIHPELLKSCEGKENICFVFNKPTFGYASELAKFITEFKQPITEIQVCGTCTDICVISNVLGLKEHMSEVKISVLEDMCAGLTEEKHNAAIEVMKSCQVEVI